MFVSGEVAVACHEARHRLRTCKNGEVWLLCPYIPGGVYSIGHYGDDGWVQCTNDTRCAWHHRRQIPKLHLPCMIIRKAYLYRDWEKLQLPKTLPYRAGEWHQMIFELTGGVLKPFRAGIGKPDKLVAVGRPPGQKNAPLELRWYDSFLTGVPADLCDMDVKSMLPAIINGEVAVSATVTDLDNPGDDPIKHKIYSRKDCNDLSEGIDDDDCAGGRVAAGPRPGPMPRGKGGAR